MEVPGAEEVNIEMQSSGLSVVVVGVWEIVLDFLQQILHPSPAMKLVDIQAIGNDQKVIPAQMVVCEQCSQSTFRIFVINGHNHLECTTCGTSYCQGDCNHGCKDDSCDQSHCVKCGSHMIGGYLPHGTVCESCKMEEELSENCPSCGSQFPPNEQGECQECGCK